MPVCGLVLTVTDDTALRAALLQRLQQDGRITVGGSEGMRWPLVTETDEPREEAELLDELSRTPGVVMVEVAYHDFSDVEEAPPELTTRRRGRRRTVEGRPEAGSEE